MLIRDFSQQNAMYSRKIAFLNGHLILIIHYEELASENRRMRYDCSRSPNDVVVQSVLLQFYQVLYINIACSDVREMGLSSFKLNASKQQECHYPRSNNRDGKNIS